MAMAQLRRILVLNAGSSSLKWSLLDLQSAELLSSESHAWSQGGEALSPWASVLASDNQIVAVAHRLTHGGAHFASSVRIDSKVRAALQALLPLDPLHLRPQLAAIDATIRANPNLSQVAVFDTSFHGTIPQAARTYAVPHEWVEKFGVRRFGFHGLSVDWAVTRSKEMLGFLPPKMIVCHLGSGCSVTAVVKGQSVDTTMGLTPLDGVVMATRPGALDPGVVLHMLGQPRMTPQILRTMLNESSGWLGISQVSADFREVMGAADNGNERARLAVDVFVHSVRRALGAMMGVLGGADAVVFTGGIGENNARIRALASAALPGLAIDTLANDNVADNKDAVITRPLASIRGVVIHAREDLVMLREARALL